MHIRTFRAANLNDALRLIRDQMGPDATVLHTRQIASVGWKFWGRNQIEVTAGLRHQSFQQSRQNDALLAQLVDLGISLKIAQQWIQQAEAWQAQTGPAGDMKAGNRLHAGNGRWENLQRWLANQIATANPIDVRTGDRRIVTLVGATGVGKTTTIAKLAGQFCIDQKSRVGLLTVDAFRAAAVEQLQAFARALQIPLEVVREVDQVGPALERLDGVDLLLVDTIGQSPRETRRLDRLASLLRAIEPDETFLVLDANSSLASAKESLRAFAKLGPTALILSKVDEVRNAAPVLAAVIESNLCDWGSPQEQPGIGLVTQVASNDLVDVNLASQLKRKLGFSYLTNGQSVPRDIEVADVTSLAKLASGLALESVESVMNFS